MIHCSCISWLPGLRCAVVLLLAVLSGCTLARESSPSRFYLLDAAPAESAAAVSDPGEDMALRIGLSRISVPSYLDRPQIVSRLPHNQLEYAEFHRWGESLGDGISRVVRANLVEFTGSQQITAYPWHQDFPRDYNLHLIILAFEPDLARHEAVLNAVYRISDSRGRETLAVVATEIRAPLPAGGSTYEERVQALSDALALLSAEIAEALIATHARNAD